MGVRRGSYGGGSRRLRGGGRGGYGRDYSEGCSLLVRNLPLDISEAIRIRFEQYGVVEAVYQPRDHYLGKPQRYGFVRFSNPEDAATAQHSLHRQVLFGREITVTVADEKYKKPHEMRTKEGSRDRPGYGRSHRGSHSAHELSCSPLPRSSTPSPRARPSSRSLTRTPSPRSHGNSLSWSPSAAPFAVRFYRRRIRDRFPLPPPRGCQGGPREVVGSPGGEFRSRESGDRCQTPVSSETTQTTGRRRFCSSRERSTSLPSVSSQGNDSWPSDAIEIPPPLSTSTPSLKGGSAAMSSIASRRIVSMSKRQRFFVELKEDEVTLISWKKLVADAETGEHKAVLTKDLPKSSCNLNSETAEKKLRGTSPPDQDTALSCCELKPESDVSSLKANTELDELQGAQCRVTPPACASVHRGTSDPSKTKRTNCVCTSEM